MKFFWVLTNLFTASLTFAAPAEVHSRVNVLTLRAEGYAPAEPVRSYLDIGLELTEAPEGKYCKILDPKAGTRAASAAWSPFDFYTNVLNEDQQEAHREAGTLGEPSVFFPNDLMNRNGAGKSHEWTRDVTPEFKTSLEFLEKKRGKDWVSFVIQFTRGKLIYRGLITVRSWFADGKCQVAAFDCTKETKLEDGTLNCEKDGWTRRIFEVVAQADYKGYISDAFFRVTDHKQKNDVAAVYGVFQELDKDRVPTGKAYREKLAPKP